MIKEILLQIVISLCFDIFNTNEFLFEGFI